MSAHICLDVLPTTPPPPAQKRDAQHKFLQHKRSTPKNPQIFAENCRNCTLGSITLSATLSRVASVAVKARSCLCISLACMLYILSLPVPQYPLMRSVNVARKSHHHSREGNPPKNRPHRQKEIAQAVCTNSFCLFLLFLWKKGGQFAQTVPKLFAQTVLLFGCFFGGGWVGFPVTNHEYLSFDFLFRSDVFRAFVAIFPAQSHVAPKLA